MGLIGSTVITLSPDNRVVHDPLAIPAEQGEK